MYLIYSIHCESFALSILNAYPSFKESMDGLRGDVLNYLNVYKGITNAITVNKKDEIMKATTDGYFLKSSNKYPNRISLYQRMTQDIGMVFSSLKVNVRRLMVFSSIEFSTQSQTDTQKGFTFQINNIIATPLKNIARVPYIDELKVHLEQRRKTIEGKMD